MLKSYMGLSAIKPSYRTQANKFLQRPMGNTASVVDAPQPREPLLSAALFSVMMRHERTR